MDAIWIRLFVGLIFGIICAAIASSKGRSTVGWFFGGFFLSLLGLIILVCLSNKKEEQARQNYLDQENRRLREQIRQEQIKAESFRSHTQRRLDMHDQTLGLDTRTDTGLLDGQAPMAGLLEQGGQAAAPGVAAAPLPDDAASGARVWYYVVEGQTYGPVASANVIAALRQGAISRSTLVWMQGMSDWATLDRVPEFNALVNS